MIGVFTHFPRLLHLSFTFFLVAIVRCGKTLVIHDNRVRRRNIKTLLFVCLKVERMRQNIKRADEILPAGEPML